MALNKKFVTRTGLVTENIEFTSPNGSNIIQMSMTDTDTITISGNVGQLFSITDTMSGVIFGVNDVSGIPSIEVDDDGTIRLAESFGRILVGTTTDNGTDKIQINGSTTTNGIIRSTRTVASGLSTWSNAKTVLGNIHIANGAGTLTTNQNQAAITFQGDSVTEAQAGIYVLNNNSNGTMMAFATTNSYTTGPQIATTISGTGIVNFLRARPTYAGNTIMDAANIGSYAPSLTGVGASGAWGISAATLTTPRSINGTTFNGSADITITDPSFAGYLASYAISDYDTPTTSIGGVNFRYGTSSATNRPSGTDHSVFTQSYSSTWATQMAADWRTNKWYLRSKNNGVWTSWGTVLQSTDIGTSVQANLVSGTNFKTIAGVSMFASGNINALTDNTSIVSGNSVDFNTLTTVGIYRVQSDGTWTGSTNGPTLSYPFGIVVVVSHGLVTNQTYYSHHASGNWSRTKFNASDWTSWSKQLSTNNMGVGSSLDADLLDGQHGSYYQQALVSGTNIKTVNGVSVLGSGNVETTWASITNKANSWTGLLGSSATTKNDISVRVDSGFYESATPTTATGWPSQLTTWSHLFSSTHSNITNYQSMQFAASFYNNNDIFYRATNNNGTGAWSRMWNESNDGAGSGLDADLLDGQHASAFQPTLSSGTNIKTINGTSLLGSGNIDVTAVGGATLSDVMALSIALG